MIELMIHYGSPIGMKCKNKLFADGTALHLAAMNGSIEAASILLRKAGSRGERTEFKTLDIRDDKNVKAPKDEFDDKNWLKERDAEGQTPLMRSAAARSKRLDTIRDLLRKNLWSLSGRPAEMALFLINKGADWRETEPISNMNLMHLAIVNDYNDIVNMLLVLDRQLINIPAKIAEKNREVEKKSALEPDEPKSNLVSINLDTKSGVNSNNSPSASPKEFNPATDSKTNLLTKQERASDLLERGLKPLELAIIYGRLHVIQLLWFVKPEEEDNEPKGLFSEEAKNKSKRELRAVLSKACWSSKVELGRTIRVTSFRLALAADLMILTIFWMPYYLNNPFPSNSGSFFIRSGIFILSYCATILLAARITFSNPGYLKRNTQNYLNEVSELTGRNLKAARDLPKQENSNKSGSKMEASSVVDMKSADKSRSIEERVRLLCHKCRCIRKARSRHCNYCNRCIQDFDHHCIYLANCVGRNNRVEFLVMILMVSLTAIYGSLLYATSSSLSDTWNFIRFMWIFKYVLIGAWTAALILRRACLGVTMYEELRSNRIRKIFGPSGPPDEIEKSHEIYSIKKGSFWRYSPDRFVTGDLAIKKILHNLREFSNNITMKDFLLSVVCADNNLSHLFSSGSPAQKKHSNQ